MKLNELTTQLKRLDKLSKEISRINDFAKKIKDKSVSVMLNMDFAINEQAHLPKPTQDTWEATYNIFSGFQFINESRKPKKEAFSMHIDEVSALQVLGVLICTKESERMQILNWLKESGINV